MSAHPMLQPTDWSQAPETLLGSMPEKRLALYRLIWNCALACTLRAPILEHARATFVAANGKRVAFARTCSAATQQGYWRFRTDFPRTAFPRSVQAPALQEMRVLGAWAARSQISTLGSLILAMQEQGIGTPSSAAGILKNMLEPPEGSAQSRQPLIVLQTDKPGEPDGRQPQQPAATPALEQAHVQITEHGRRQLAAWYDAGLIGCNRTNNQTIEAVARGDMTLHAGLQSIFRLNPAQPANTVHQAQADAAAEVIDAICQLWSGLGRDQALQGMAVARNTHKRSGLPTWLDPEVALPPEHPLRALKKDMQAALISARPEWETLEQSEKAKASLDWLRHYCAHGGALATVLSPHMFGEMAQFSALRYWLTGARP